MNRFILCALAPLVLVSSAFATMTTCPTGAGTSLNNYLAPGFACTINALTFNDWTYASSTVSATDIAVTPILTAGDEGFQFNSIWAASTVNAREDSTIGFTASGVTFTALQLSLLGAATGTGTANVTEQYCFSNAVSSCPPGPPPQGGQIMVTNPPPNFTDVVFMAPQTSISVLKDIGVSAGSGIGSSATISQVTNQFSNSPEPLSFVLLGSGLLGLGLLRKRIKR